MSGKPEANIDRKTRERWQDIKTDLKERIWKVMRGFN